MEIANKTPGSKQCNKPGNSSKPSLKKLKKMQEDLKEEMRESRKRGKKGKKKGENKSDEGEKQTINKWLKKQQQIRQIFQKIRDEIGENGEKGNIDRILEKMEENETDILNNKISSETLLRQEEILTKLLESFEESQRERVRMKKESL